MNVYANDFNTTVQTYYTSLRKYKSISREKEIELFKLIKNDDEQAKKEIIESHLKFVFDVAKSYKGKGVPLEDLISEGNIGLTKAINRFDENKGVKFISYAVWWIKQSILDCLRKRNKISYNEILEDDNVSNKNNDFYFESLDDNDIDDNDENYKVTTEYDDFIKELNEVKSNVIKKLLKKLPYRGQKIIIYYYGLNNEEEKNLEEIGQELGITKERVRQIKEKCLKILRSEILMMDNFNDLFM